jgi:hypothetical protein
MTPAELEAENAKLREVVAQLAEDGVALRRIP